MNNKDNGGRVKLKDGFSGERSLVLPKVVVDQVKNDPLISALYVTDIGYYPHAMYHFRERQEPIGTYVFIYCVDGRGGVTINGRTHDIVANQYVVLPPDEPHSYHANNTDPWTIYWIHFSGYLAERYAQGADFPRTVDLSADSRIHTRINLFEEIFKTLSSGIGIENMGYATSLLHHYLGSLRFISQYRSAATQSGKGRIDSVDSALHYLAENIEHSVTLRQLADFVGMSATHLGVLFRLRTGHSPMSYFNLLKITEVCRLLDTTDMKLNQLCYKVGFSDPYYLSRLFHKVMGISPSAYRCRSRR